MAYITDDNDNLIEVQRTNKPNLEGLIKEHSKEVQRIQKLNAINEFYKSLMSAVESAGGSPDWITEATTVKELADKLAINNVRFNHIKPVTMKVEVLIHEDKSNKLQFIDTYEISSRDQFREMVYEIEDIKDNIEDDLDLYCTITLNFNWQEADNLNITEEDCNV